MKKLALFAFTLLSAWAMTAKTITGPVDYVSPLVGTQSKHALSTGNTYPAIALPWGMNFWVPQTGKMGDGWAYTYDADKIRGFKQTHQPSPWINDYGQFAIMPVTGKAVFNQDERASWFSHKAETATPYYYKVYLADHDVVTEIAPTERAAAFRFTFPENDHSYVVVDAFDKGSFVKVIPSENKIIGYTTKNSGGVPANFKNYFVLVFDKPFTYTAAVASGVIDTNKLEATDNHAGALIGFKTRKGEQVNVRVASSFISPEQAELNLKELGTDNVEQIAAKGRKIWNDVLGRIEVKDDDIDHLRTFYSCLYRSVLFPRSFYEIDAKGDVMHYSPYNGEVLPGYMFTDTGFWDTFRCLFPFLNLMYPSMNTKMQEGLVNTYKESGFLPEWASPGHRGCMVGNNSASVVADAYLKGLKGYDIETLWEAVKHGANAVHPNVGSTGRLGHEYYNKLGYVPYNVKINESAARTLEYAYDDWTIYKLAQSMGNQKVADEYKKRALSYRNLFDKELGFARPRYADGTWKPAFSLLNTHGEGFIEGNSLNYSFFVPHDVKGMINLMGGDKAFIRRLDNLFGSSLDPSYYAHTEDVTKEGILGGYIHGNEPSHHIPYLYMWTSQPWKTSENIYKIIDKMYNTRIDGLCGNDDCGQMSAWYIFTALGFYPVCPGSDEYIFGLPQIQQAEISLKAGKKLKIQVCNQSEENKYIQAIYWNGERYTKRFISHHTLIEGGNLIYEMGNKPAETCFDKYSLPYSLSSEDNHRIIPAVQEQQVYASNLNLSSGYHIVLQDNRLENERLWLKKYLQNDFQLIENSQGKTIRLILQSSSEQKEDEYQIDIQDEVKIISPSARGIFYGIQTLRQLMITTAGQCSLPQLAIKDRPYYPWRAYMLDESRVFQGKEAVKSILDEMARLKMNIFHWHLTDDQGWRIEIKKYPKLCQIGARRDSTQLNGWKGNSFDGKVHEGYYTQKEIKEIIEYAQSLHIQIIPEIEMPGHSSAVIAAYPEFGTTKKQIKVPCSFGVQYEVLDVSSQKVIQFLHDVLDEVIALFPSPIIHIGGDEVKYDQWNASVAISNYIKKLGVANPAELQIEFTNAISEWLKGRNKHMMGWNDIMGNKIHEYNSAEDAIALKSKLAEGTIVQFWKGDLDLIEETAQKGYDIVNSYHYGTYLDYDKSRIPLAKSYAFNPIPAGMDKSLQYKILGLGCQMWGEQILTVESMNRMTFPRIAAYAEIGWISPARKNYMEFLPALMRLVKFNKHYETGER